MKKNLLLQTALVAAAGVMLADASFAQVKAEPIAVTVGGYMQRGLKLMSNDGGQVNTQPAAGVDRRGANTFGDSEVWFNIRAVLDNGLRIGGRIELEGQTELDQIDESYAFFEHNDWGRLEIGTTDRVWTKMIYGAPNAIPGNSTIVFSTEASPIVAPTSNRSGAPLQRLSFGDDAEGINLYTSSLRYFGSKAGKGIQLGFSYSPDGCQDSSTGIAGNTTVAGQTACVGGASATTAGSGEVGALWQVAANYLESFGQVDVALFGAWAGYEIDANNAGTATAGSASVFKTKGLNGWAVGTSLTYNVGDGSTVTLGGGYKKEEQGTKVAGATTGDDERKAWNVGLRYLTNGANPGSIGVGAEYSRISADQGNIAGAAVAGEDKTRWVSVGVTYQLAAGILLYAGGGQYEFTDQTTAGSQVGGLQPNGNVKNEFGVVGFSLTF